MVLESQGHEILEAENGNDGIDADATYMAKLIITDIIMPGKEGIETIKYFRATRPTVKIIAISGGGDLQHNTPLATAKMCGADRILTKPISNQNLLEAVDACLLETGDP